MTPDVLYVLDASNWAHKAHHAGGPGYLLETLDGMLRAFLARAGNPRFVVAAMDGAGPTFREELYSAYKANREYDPKLVEQLPDARDVFERYGIRCLDPGSGSEADDVMASLATQVDFRAVMLLSADLDLLQVVSAVVKLGTRRQGSQVVYDGATVRSRFGVEPEQWPDVLALAGKKSNGYPGLPGIGRKGACDLIGKYGSLDKLLDRPSRVARKSHRLVLEKPANIAAARLYLTLARLRTDLPVPLSPGDLERVITRIATAYGRQLNDGVDNHP